MTVKELIEELKKFPQNKTIVYADSCLLNFTPNRIYEYKPVYSFEPYIEAEETIVVIDTDL